MAAEAEAEAAAIAADEAEKELTRKALKQKAGGEVAFQNMLIESRQIADELGIYATLEKKGLASDPDIIGMLHDIKNKTAEGILKPGTPPIVTKDPLEEMEEIKQSDAFKQKFHPKHKETMERFMQLNQEIANKGLAPKRPQGG